jgi:RNA polymerase sigma factor (sigma-70 family)
MEPRRDRAALGVVDVATVRGAQRGDVLALDVLIREISPYVGRICAAIALEDGEDAMQEALIAIARGVKSLREPAVLKAWVRRIAVREAVRVARRRRPSVPVDKDLAATDISIDASLDVRSTLASLRPEQRVVLVLRDLDGYSEREVAALLSIPPGTVKSRLHRARAAFVRRWDP